MCNREEVYLQVIYRGASFRQTIDFTFAAYLIDCNLWVEVVGFDRRFSIGSRFGWQRWGKVLRFCVTSIHC
jgi:hypothetical protein